MATTLPPQAAEANARALSQALADAHLDDNDTGLEEGEIEEGGYGGPKTVFDDPNNFDVKVGPGRSRATSRYGWAESRYASADPAQHPLYAKWTLYFDSPQSKLLPKTPSSAPGTPGVAHGGWMEDIRKVVEFSSVEEFWGTYNNIVAPSQLPIKANYYLFKDGIMPAWEDPENKNGGKWSVQVPKDKSRGVIDKMWLYTMLAAIGETYETPLPTKEEPNPVPKDSNLVTGVLMSCRGSFYRISIWTRQAPDTNLPESDPLMARILTIGRYLKVNVLGYALDQKLVQGSLQSEVTFESHKDSEKKANKNKIVV